MPESGGGEIRSLFLSVRPDLDVQIKKHPTNRAFLGERFRVQGSRFKVQGSRFKVQGSRFKVGPVALVYGQ
jgi:hypothetical protein